jgi:hypothetical protein
MRVPTPSSPAAGGSVTSIGAPKVRYNLQQVELRAGRIALCLTPVAYEFPTGPPGEIEANWLVVQVDVRADKASWSSRAACLTTWEARDVAPWLRRVVAGVVSPTLAGPDGLQKPNLTFIEPSLAFSVAPSGDSRLQVRVHLTHTLAAPWLDVDERCQAWEHFVELQLTDQQLLNAASVWEEERRTFPPR